MHVSIDAFRSFDKVAQNFLQYELLHWMKNVTCQLSHLILRLFWQTSFMAEFLFLFAFILMLKYNAI